MIPQVDGAYDDLEEDEEDETCDSDSFSETINVDNYQNEQCFRLMLTNTRSAIPKMNSIKDAFNSLSLHFACLTETWFRGGKVLKEKLINVEGSSGLRILHKSRDGRRNGIGGGVALVFNTASCNFKNRNLKHATREQEILCCVGRVGKIKRKIVVFTVYVSPSMKKAEVDKLREVLSLEICAAKASYGDPIFIVGGDLNHLDLDAALEGPDIFSRIVTTPTRGSSVLDVLFSNIGECLTEKLVLPPLQTDAGAPSDHRCVYAEFKMPDCRPYTWVVKYRRRRTRKTEENLAKDLENWDWDELRDCQDVDSMWASFARVIETLNEIHFPMERTRKRSNEHPWITKSIRRLWKKKVRIYKKGGKTHRWWEVDRRLQDEIS